MNFFVSAGHPMYKGAVGILDETVVDRAVVKELDIVLREMGHTVTVLNSESAKDYVEEVQVANSSSYDWYVDIHANCYSKESANGVETLVYADNKPEAHSISKNISELGFYNRGVKVRTDLYILKNTKAKALLVECFFISNKNDCDLYNKVGAKAIAIAIAEGLTGQTYKSNEIEKPTVNETIEAKPVQPTDDWVARLQAECNKQGYSNQVVDNIAGKNTLAGCPTLKKGSKGNITKLLQEKLISLGYDLGKHGADGDFGTATYNAVVKFQKDNGLTTDGIVGQNTWRKLLNL